MENVQYDAETLEFFANCDHFTALQNELGYQSIWSIYDAGQVGLDFEILNKKSRLVRYEYVRPDATTCRMEESGRQQKLLCLLLMALSNRFGLRQKAVFVRVVRIIATLKALM